MSKFIIRLVGACLSLSPFVAHSAKADGVLEKIQDEVAIIVKRSTGGIVSIQDERLLNFFMKQKGPPPDIKIPGDKPPPIFEAMRKEFPNGFPKIGSGFMIGDGYILSTSDVLDGMQNPLVVTQDGKFLKTVVIGIDREQNVGLLKLASKSNLPSLTLGNSDYVLPGHFAISIGNQFGHTNSVALTMVAGVRDEGVSAPDHFYASLIQISGTVGAGASGAPLLNARGEVIGMVAAVPSFEGRPAPDRPHGNPEIPPRSNPANPDHGSKDRSPNPEQDRNRRRDGGRNSPSSTSSTGYAIPINDARMIMQDLIEKRTVHAWLGVDLSFDRDATSNNGNFEMSEKVVVKSVYPGSPALASGIAPGDVLVSLNNRPAHRVSLARAILIRLRPGDSLKMRTSRNGKEREFEVKLTTLPLLISDNERPGQ